MKAPRDVYLEEVARTGDWTAGIRAVRREFGFDLTKAKEVMLQAQGLASSLDDHQAQLAEHLPASLSGLAKSKMLGLTKWSSASLPLSKATYLLPRLTK